MKIEWLKSGKSSKWQEQNYLNGGSVYETYTRNILRTKHNVKVTYLPRGNSNSKLRHLYEFGKYFQKSKSIRFWGDIIVRDVFSTIFVPFDTKHKHIVMLHHLDVSDTKYKRIYNIFVKQFYKKVLLADVVVVVSEYWKNRLFEIGCSNVSVIYNSFDLSLFNFSQRELIDFRKRLNICIDKPLIYLGNARPEKGFIETYNALKDINAIFIATGKKEINLPIFQKFLSYTDYLKLLKLSSLVITMSKFNEGWNRTAHEAMLCGTPVIGSGKGGMRELLKRGGQIICDDFNELKSIVLDVINNKKVSDSISLNGREFASQFNLDYFKESWMNLIHSFSIK